MDYQKGCAVSAFSRRRGSLGRGFTLIELLVAVVIISILAALLLTTISKARERGRGIVCLGNLRQIGLSVRMYNEDNSMQMPPFFFTAQTASSNGQYSLSFMSHWSLADIGPGASMASLVCPSDRKVPVAIVTNNLGNPTAVPCSYGYNFYLFLSGIPATSVRHQSTILLFDGSVVSETAQAWWGKPSTGYGPGGSYTWCHCPPGNPDPDLCQTLTGTGPVPPGHLSHPDDYWGPCGGGAAGNLALINQPSLEILAPRHLGKSTVLFLDSHVEKLDILPTGSLMTP